MTVLSPTISRRDIINNLGKGAAVIATASALPVSAKAAVGGHQTQYGMVIDTRRCSGCHACSVACKSEFDVPLGNTRSWVEFTEKGTYPNVSRSFLPRLCNQCSEPQCVSVCPTGATYQREEDGIVVVDPDVCIGCKYCMQACPYDARFINPKTGAADKCDFCLHRVSQGVVPSCVNTCVAGPVSSAILMIHKVKFPEFSTATVYRFCVRKWAPSRMSSISTRTIRTKATSAMPVSTST